MAETVVDQGANSSTVLVENEVCFYNFHCFYDYLNLFNRCNCIYFNVFKRGVYSITFTGKSRSTNTEITIKEAET